MRASALASALTALDALSERERVASVRVVAAAEHVAGEARALRRAVTSGVRAWTADHRPRPCVLVVEDGDALRDGLIAALHAAGLDAEGARTLDEARGGLAQTPAVMILDVHLGAEGLSLPLLSERPSATRVVIVSAHADVTALDALARSQRADWMPRPVDAVSLTRLVALVCERVKEATQ